MCIKCLVTVVDGAQNLSPPDREELDLREVHDFPKTDRLSCQTTILGDVTLDTKYW